MKSQVNWKETVNHGNVAGILRPSYDANIPFGHPKPLQHYRRGRIISDNPEDQKRIVNTAKHHYTVSNIMDKPASVTFSHHDEPNNCYIVSQYQQNYTQIHCSDDIAINKKFNPDTKARQRVQSASTVIKPNYHQTHLSYLKSKCNTYEQKAFQFKENGTNNPDEYRGNCSADSCNYVAYKRKNKVHATNSAVSASTHILDLQNKTINNNNDTNSNKFNKNYNNNECEKALRNSRQFKTSFTQL